MQRVKFGLHEGLKGEDLLNELRGKISGETRQEVVSLLEKNGPHQDIPLPDHEILKEDPVRELAILVKRHIQRDFWGQLRISASYYLAGINDEGFYFAHRIDNFPISNAATIESVLEWINRADQGYAKRLQGDVLIQFRAPPQITIVPSQYDKSRYEVRIHNGRSENSAQFEAVDGGKMIMLGNHRLSTDGSLYVSRWSDTLALVAVVGKQIMMQHPEHGITTMEIPPDHLALIHGQRGRLLSMDGNNIAGFD